MIGAFRRMRDEQYRRASNRRRTEEVMAWICVPIILFFVWLGMQAWDEVVSQRARPGGGGPVAEPARVIQAR